MASKVSVTVTDDLDDSEGASTVVFGLDGNNYEIDLSDKNEAKLRKALAPYVEHARRAPKTGGNVTPIRRGRARGASGLNTQEVRQWAASQGIEVKERGRIPADVIAKYEAAQAS